MAGTVGLKIDVDTFLGMKRGVPRLLDILGGRSIRATFFLSFGPDRSGRALFNVFRRKGFLKKMLRTKAPAMYGFRTMLYGTLLPAPLIAARFPELTRRIEEEGHEVGVHAWDHRLWQDHLDTLSRARIAGEFGRAFGTYEEILGHPPPATAAPAWYVTSASLAVQDELGLEYCSDTRGRSPFLPELGPRLFGTVQVPTTMACIEEVMGREAQGERELLDSLYAGLREEAINVFPVHAEVEGNRFSGLFLEFLRKAERAGFTFTTLGAIRAALKGKELPRCPVLLGEIPGRSGVVALQGGGEGGNERSGDRDGP